ncbi:MAG: DUF3592 domain-containing protein [Candidatus Heimdallarchaeota archaeon]|nr:DUF3592 domain-containing protein [Candidatus Heimdallarchaeota archaeon]
MEYINQKTYGCNAVDLFSILSLIILLGAGIPLSYIGIKNTYLGRSSMQWKQTGAIISNSKLDAVGNQVIEYEYKVDGVTYKGDNLCYDGGFSTNHEGKEIEFYLTNAKKGDYVEVYFNPKRPEMSVVHPGVKNYMYILALFPLIMLAAFMIFFVTEL